MQGNNLCTVMPEIMPFIKMGSDFKSGHKKSTSRTVLIYIQNC